MKFIPILFSTPMVQAEQDGRKTKTRRTKGLELVNKSPDKFKLIGDSYELDISHKAIKYDDRIYYLFNEKNSNQSDYVVRCPYKKGDILWVREKFREYYYVDEAGCTQYDKKIIEYAADNPPMIPEMDGDGFQVYKKDGTEKFIPWKPSLFMPKSDCRIFLKVKSIRVERLQDISEKDAESEGINIVDFNCYENYLVDKNWQYNGMNQKGFHMIQDPIGSFASLWAKINGEQSWNDNPFVWVIEFERIEKPENFK